MVDVKELRVGNFVNRLGELTIVNSITQAEEGVSYVSTIKSGVVTQNQIEPIPLTEEWLLKFGFKKAEDSSSFNIGSFIIYPDWNGNQVIYNASACIYYVHQLQNLYFALRGEEICLTSTPK